MEPCIMFFSHFILFDQFNLCLNFYYHLLKWKIILINKSSQHNRVSVMSFEIKYLDLYMSFDFSIFIFLTVYLFIRTHSCRFIWLYKYIKKI